MKEKMKKTGVLLINMGGPRNLEEIPGYLYRIFTDPYIMGMPPFVRVPLAKLIVSLRKKKVIERYKLIGGKSPLDEYTAAQARELEKILGMPVSYAMRYIDPSVETAQQELIDKGVEHIFLLPLYPQQCNSTTLTALVHFEEHLKPGLTYNTIGFHYDTPGYVDTMSTLLQKSLEAVEPGLKTTVVFVAHSIPLKQVIDGDPYIEQVEATVSSIMKQAAPPFPHVLAYQSKVGPVKWQGPSLEEILKRLVSENVEQVVVQPVSFVCENLETLFDLDIDFKTKCNAAGIRHFTRVPAPGTHPLYIKALADLVQEVQNALNETEEKE